MKFETVMYGVFAGLSWLIVILVLVQLSRFLKKFDKGSHDLEANIISMAEQLRKMQTTLAELLIEQRRVTRLTVEGLDLKKAEMTGEFEIVEEPLPGTPGGPQIPEHPSISELKQQNGPHFPELMK
ncbi:MAG: hypothetical protein LBM70_09865 [Victivallales bacterium]|jgi:hypothetical protein|nr:hypothetical protein [Victivallales bacterium]